MSITLIAAMSRNMVIGKENQMPWHLPRDLKHFKSLTLGKTIVMGRNTFEAIGSKPLPKRQNVILTRNTDYTASGCVVVHDLNTVLSHVSDNDELMIIGGAQIYELFFPLANKMALTYVDTTLTGDCYFPKWNESEWQETMSETHAADEKNAFAIRFVTLERQK